MTLAETGIIPHILGPTTGGGPLQTLIWNPIWQQIGWAYWDLINRAKNWTWPRDPLILDLDGDGLETVGLAADVHFDHDGDGVLTRTGWAGADDALLVRDIDGNGRIDTGAELFGDFTPLADGSLAANGFAALAALDANGDGMIDANDPAFDMLRLWRDANQNGLSDADELISLTDAGIHSLNVGSSLMNRNLANGNQLAREGSFTRSDGTTAALGEFRLAADTFSARFLDAIDIPESIASLPSMRGSGKVRELQQAAALSDALVDTLSLFQATSTRAEQKSLLDQLLGDWADTSTMARTLEERTGGDYRIRYEAFGNERRSSNVVGSTTGVGNIVGFLSDADDPLLSESYRTLIAEWSHKIHVLEAFGGQYFFNLPTQKSQTAGANWGLNITAGSGTSGIASLPLLRLDYSQPQLDLLQQAYDDLKENVYASLVMQTRLKPYLDQIELSIDDSGVHLDATALNQMLADRKSLDPENYLADLLDLDRYASHFLYGTNWTGLAEFDAIIDSLPPTEGIVSLLAEFNVRILGNDDGSMQLGNAADFVLAGDGNDTLYGYGGNDRLFGQDGNDRLLGGGGDDLLSGGAGNDVLIGETGADTYVFGRGNGHDIILDNVENGVRRDTVRFIGLVPADIRIGADHEDKLVFVIIETGETLSVPAQGYHWGANGVGRYVFDDGTVWSHDDALRETVASATDGDDLIHGSSTADVIIGEPGNDTLIGNGGDDVLDGGPGNDILIGSTSWLRVYDEGQYRFERDTKPLVAANGNDTYLFGHGDGRDTIFDGDRTSGNVDTLRFKDDVSPDEVRLIRDGNDLVLAIRGTTDQVTLTKYFEETHDGQNGSWLIERIVFADGTSWTYSDVRNLLFAGSDDADLIVGTSAPDVLSGRGGDDVLLGGAGHDLLDGGPGNDVLRGGAVLFSNKVIGDLHGEGDSYRFGRGDGHDLIIEDSWLAGEVDRIELKAGIGPEDIRLERVRSLDSWPVIDSLRLTIRDTGETLTVSNHFDQSNRFAIEEIVFDDGTTWDMEAIRARALLGDAGNDELLGFSDRDDLIVGGAGNDRLVGLSGDDVLVGGPGDDALEGGQGSDTYRFGLGDGNDVIIDGSNEGFDVLELGAGITTADVTVRWTRQSGMSVTLADGSSVNVLYQAERWSDRNGIEALHFDDGTSWDRSTLASRALVATSGDDLIVGSYENDTLDGGAGDDHFWNLGGHDTYLFGFGDGHDVIEATYGRISFKTGVDQNGIDFSRNGDDLIVTITASGDALCLNDWLGGGQSIDSFTFANGASLNAREVLARLELDTGYEILYGSPGADTLVGSAGNSTIFGREGDDILIGGAGNDTLYGEAGDDTLDGGADRDLLHGGAGTNTYIVAPGTALDTASGASGAIADDTVVFSSGIRPTDLSIQLGDDSSWWGSQPGDTGYTNLVIGFGGNDALIVQNDDGRDLARGAIQHFRFDDGTEWTLADVIAHADDGRMGAQDRDWDGPLTLLGSQADDWIYDFSDQSVTVQARGNDDYVYLAAGNNRVSAGSGEDTVYLGQGNDLIAGEAGDDTIEAGDGDDLIVFNYGDGYDWLSAGRGVDTLSFGSNVTPAMLAATIDRYGNTTLLIDAGAGGTITLAGYDQDGPAAGLERLQFIDDEGRARIFDLDGWLRSNAIALLNATTESPLEFDGDNFELTGSVAPAGGLEAIAYAQSGDLFAAAAIAHNSPTDGDDVLYGSNEDDVLDAGAGNDMVLGLDGSDVLFGGAGDDLLDGGDGDDTLDGGPGNDTLYGGWGADVLVGGTGHDQLFGGWGGDTYLYQAGDGVTIIDDDHLSIGWNTGGDGDNYVVMDDTPNILHFGPGIEAGRLHFAERDGDLLITFSDRPDDQLILRGHEPGRATLTRSIDLIRFDDGSEIAAQSIAVKGLTLIASEEDDWLYGSPFADTLVGSDGDDWLVGNGGADRLLGGTGSDTYLVYKDWDAAPVQTSIHETWRERDINRIELSGDIDAADLHLALDGNELLLRLNEGGDAIRFAGFDPRADGMQAPVNEIELPWEDASLSFDDLLARGIRIIGTPDDDVLEGTPLADWFEGREANDTMHGGAGGDVYLIEADGGTDTIIDSEDGGAPNILVLPEGTSLDALRLSYDDEGFLVIDLADGGNRVRLSGFDPDDPLGARAVQRIRFGIDGDEIGYEELLARGFDIFGSEANDALRGTALDDRIFGRDDNDLIEATPGGDWLAGEGGSDTYLLQRGNGLVTIDDHATETAGNLLRFGAGIEADALHDSLRFMPDGNGGHLLAITYGADDDIVRLTGFDPQDVLGNHAIEQFEFVDDDRVDYATLTSWGFVIEGDNSANALGGTNVDDRLYGYDGDDLLEAGAGNDVLTGGRGNDLLRGGAGRDAYVFNFGDGQDLIEDEVEDGVGNVLSLGEGIRREDIHIEIDGNDLLVHYGNDGDMVRVSNHTPQGAQGGTVIDTLEFADGTSVTLREFMNRAPTLTQPIAGQVARANTAFQLTLPADLFSDPDGDDVLLRTAVASHGSLAQWLQFDAATRSLYGTPQDDDVGEFDLVIEGMDSLGATTLHEVRFSVESAGQTLSIAPDFANVVEDRKLIALGNVLANDSDPNGGSLRVTDAGIRLGSHGLLTLLPNGSYVYVLNDLLPSVQGLGAGETVADHFDYHAGNASAHGASELIVTVTGTNDAPMLRHALADVQLAKGKAFAWQLPENAFQDRDRNDTLSYTATLPNGKPLPAWLGFDPATRIFSGTAPNSLTGNLDVRITASDGNGPGSNAADVFRIRLDSRTNVPAAIQPIPGADAYPGMTPTPTGPTTVQPLQQAVASLADNLLSRFLDSLGKSPSLVNPAAVVLDRLVPTPAPRPVDESVHSAQHTGEDFSRCWSDMLTALDGLDAQRQDAPAWSNPNLGADINALAGWLPGSGRSVNGGVDKVSLLAAGTQLRQFSGLREGISQLVG